MTDLPNNNIPEDEKTIWGHPEGLFYLFFAELWERFSFYGMRALLALYLGTEVYNHLVNGKELAYEIYAAYGSLVYFTPAIGGLLADRVIGQRNAIILGGDINVSGIDKCSLSLRTTNTEKARPKAKPLGTPNNYPIL